MDVTDNAEAGPSTGPHRMRISSGGNVQAYAKFAISFLQDNPHRPLVLHTIPPESSPDKKNLQILSQSTLHQATLTAPRLISVVELIKRDYLNLLKANSRGSGKHRSIGIWQYTETGLVPAPSAHEAEGDELVRVLEGKTKPKMVHRPYLQITLSTKPLGLEKERNVTCQYVVTRRRKKGGKKQEGEQTTGTEPKPDQHVNKGGSDVEGIGQPDTKKIVPTDKTESVEVRADQGVAFGTKKNEKRKSTSSQDGGGKRKKRQEK